MNDKFDTLSEGQKAVAEMMVENAIERKSDTKTKKMTQSEMAEQADVTVRTIRNWQKDETFLEYVGYLSRIRLQSAMPDFVGVLIANLEKGQNVSTKQLDLIAKVADWLPEKQSSPNTLNVHVGNAQSIEDRVEQLAERRRNEVPNAPIQRRIEAETEEAEYRDVDE